MWLGLIFAVTACLVWGMIFVIPDMLSDFSPLEVTLGRYLSYGLLSSVLILRRGLSIVKTIPLRVWGMAFMFALIANLLYYIAVIFGLRYATAPVTVLILGMCPITIAFYGNWHAKEYRYRDLLIPCIWIIFGMVLVNVSEVDWTFSAYSARKYLIGLLCVVFALIAWSWYTVHNARFLKKNIEVPRSEWATIIGVATLFWALLFAVSLFAFHTSEVEWKKFTHYSPEVGRFLAGVLVLGIFCSWLGCYLWNQASTYLPVSLMGPFIVFETLFGLTYVFLYELRLPSLLEFIGIVLMLGGIYWAIHRNRKPPMNLPQQGEPQ